MSKCAQCLKEKNEKTSSPIYILLFAMQHSRTSASMRVALHSGHIQTSLKYS